MRPMLDKPALVAMLVAERIRAAGLENQESFWVLGLTSRNTLREARMVTLGTLDRSSIHPREVFTAALMMKGVARIIIAHNHPSGDPMPSPQDIQVTRALVEAGRVLGIAVLDHVIVGTDDGDDGPAAWQSLREQGTVVFE